MKDKRPSRVEGETIKVISGCGNIYVTVTEKDGKMYEVFANTGKSGECASVIVNALTKVISVALRSGAEPKEIIEQLEDMMCIEGYKRKGSLSCPSAIANAMKAHLKHNGEDGKPLGTTGETEDDNYLETEKKEGKKEFSLSEEKMNSMSDLELAKLDICPSCRQSSVERKETCFTCSNCGWSLCSV